MKATSLFSRLLVFVSAISIVNALTPNVGHTVKIARSPCQKRTGGRLFMASSSASSSTPVLFGSQGSRSPLVNWSAYELNLEITMGDLSENKHPFKQIPCLTDDNGKIIVFESGAILQYLYSKAKNTEGSTNGDDSESRAAAISSWISWANASLDPICFKETPEGKVYDTGLKSPNKRIDVLDDLLSKQDYLVEGGFSLADVAVASYLLYVPQFFQDVDISRWPSVVAYMKRCAERDAYGKAFGSQIQGYLVSFLESTGDKKKLFGIF